MLTEKSLWSEQSYVLVVIWQIAVQQTYHHPGTIDINYSLPVITENPVNWNDLLFSVEGCSSWFLLYVGAVLDI